MGAKRNLIDRVGYNRIERSNGRYGRDSFEKRPAIIHLLYGCVATLGACPSGSLENASSMPNPWWTASILESFTNELRGHSTSEGTLQFTKDKPLSTALIKKMAKARIAQIENRKVR